MASNGRLATRTLCDCPSVGMVVFPSTVYVTDRGLLLTTPLGAATSRARSREKPLMALPTDGEIFMGWTCTMGIMGSMERLWDVGIPALSTSVAEVLRVRSVLFQVSPVD